MLNVLKCSKELELKITLWLNHLLVIYAFLIPIHNKSKSSLFFVMLLLFLYRRNYWHYIKSALSNKIVQVFIIFYIVNVLGFIYTDNFVLAKSSIGHAKYILFPLIFLAFLDKRFSIRILTAFSLGIFFSELVSYAIRFEILPPEVFFFNHEVYSTEVSDPSPFFNHLDHNIGLAVMVSLLLYQFLNFKLSLITKLFTLLFMISATINMTLIGSRTGYVLYIVLIITALIVSYKKNIGKALIFALILLIPISYFAYMESSMVNKRVNQTIESIEKIVNEKDYDNSLGLRVGLSMYSLEVIKNNPIIGVGTGDYMDELHSVIPFEHSYLKRLKQPHNVYIKTLLQFGIIGFISFLYIFYALFKYKDTSEENKGMLIILSMAVLVVMLPGKFYGFFVLPMFVTLVSAFIVNSTRDIQWQDFDLKMGLKYVLLTIIFLLIGITK